MSIGGIVLCGGHSSRMGQPKAGLLMGDESLLARIVRVVGEVVQPIVVVAASEQEIPSLPDAVKIARDRMPERGPMEGIAVGLNAISGACEAAFVASCDLPLLQPPFVRFLCESLRPEDAAVAVRRAGVPQPLAAVYRTTLAPSLDERIARGELSMRHFLAEISTRWLDAEQLRHVDPDLSSFLNVNTPEEYQAALARFHKTAH